MLTSNPFYYYAGAGATWESQGWCIYSLLQILGISFHIIIDGRSDLLLQVLEEVSTGIG